MLLFIAVASALYVLYTKPETVPGHPVGPAERPVSYTRVPGPAQAAPSAQPAPGPAQAQVARAEGDAAAGTSSDEAAEGGAHEAAGTEDAE